MLSLSAEGDHVLKNDYHIMNGELKEVGWSGDDDSFKLLV